MLYLNQNQVKKKKKHDNFDLGLQAIVFVLQLSEKTIICSTFFPTNDLRVITCKLIFYNDFFVIKLSSL